MIGNLNKSKRASEKETQAASEGRGKQNPMDHPDREKPRKREFLMPRNPSPPDWREFDELEGLVVQRKFRGVGALSDQNRKTIAQGNNNVQNYL